MSVETGFGRRGVENNVFRDNQLLFCFVSMLWNTLGKTALECHIPSIKKNSVDTETFYTRAAQVLCDLLFLFCIPFACEFI